MRGPSREGRIGDLQLMPWRTQKLGRLSGQRAQTEQAKAVPLKGTCSTLYMNIASGFMDRLKEVSYMILLVLG